jgi:hypothetical protein
MDIDRFVERTKCQNALQDSQILVFREGGLKNCDAVPGWVKGEDLFCWCEKHFRWNKHGYPGGRVVLRAGHHEGHKTSLAIVVQGEAPESIRQILRYYLQSEKKKRTPPPFPMVRVIRAA